MALKIKKEKVVLIVVAVAVTVGCFVVLGLHTSLAAADQKDGAAQEPAQVSQAVLDWAEGLECAGCHGDQDASATSDKAAFGAHVAFGLECVACHTDEALPKIHEGVDASSKLPSRAKKTSVDSELACLTCHDQEALAEATADSTVLTDKDGLVVNPHKLPATESHEEEVGCGSCHKMHSDKPVKRTAMATCNSCHHANVFACGTCHEE